MDVGCASPRSPSFLRALVEEAGRDSVGANAAALAYFAVFSLPGVLVLVIAAAGAIWDPAAVQARMFEELRALMGPRGADAIREALEHASHPSAGTTVGQALAMGALAFGALGFFLQLQSALNRIWGSEGNAKRHGVAAFLVKRLLSFGMVLGLALLVLLSLALHAGLSALGDRLASRVGAGATSGLLLVLESVASTILATALLAAVYRALPDLKIAWREVWIGAFFTAVLLQVGKVAIGAYLGKADPGSVYGAAGPLVLVLVWIYYSALLVLLGAEFTQVYACRLGPQAARRAERRERVKTSAAA
jgi:membrane protein